MADTSTLRETLCVDVRRLQELPPLPGHIQRLLEVLADDEVSVPELAEVIEQIPPLAARIVGLARSAYFATPIPARSVADAIIRVLGMQLARSLSMGIAVSGQFHADRCPRFSADQYWASALLGATLSRMLARAVESEPRPDPDAAYLCGLLHNIGLLALVHLAPGEMSRVFEIASDAPERRLTEIERDTLGVQHCEIGAWLAERWQLPEELIAVIEHHHDPQYRDVHWQSVLLTGVSSRWSRQHLAGVEQPWVEPDSVHALGISQESLETALTQTRAKIDEIAALGPLFANGH